VTPDGRIRPRAPAGQARWLAVGVAASVGLHAALLGALLLWRDTEPMAEPPGEGAVAMVFADIVDPGGTCATPAAGAAARRAGCWPAGRIGRPAAAGAGTARAARPGAAPRAGR
jgi:hypothetical protein